NNIIKLFQYKRRKRNIIHIHNNNNNILISYHPDSLQEDNYIANIEAIIENGAYHSDEVSEMDDEKTQEEVSRHIRPKNKNESDHHVIRVYNKPWQSRRVSKWLYSPDRKSVV